MAERPQAPVGGGPQIPRGIAKVDQAGLDTLMREGVANPAWAREVVQQFEANPKALIAHLFDLTPAQFRGISTMSDAEVKALGQPLVAAVDTGRFAGWSIHYPNHDPRVFAVKGSCTCKVEVT
jgi:hypothetical protein